MGTLGSHGKKPEHQNMALVVGPMGEDVSMGSTAAMGSCYDVRRRL